jgi:hypothetical protein
MNKSPAFQFYPDKWVSDTRRLSWKAKGLFWELISVIWIQFQSTCDITNDDDYIAAELGAQLDDWKTARAEIMRPERPLLVVTETNRLFCAGLFKEFEKQRDRRERLRLNGLLGGRPKNQKVISEKPKRNLNKRLPSPFPSSSPSPPLGTIKRQSFRQSDKATKLSRGQKELADRFEAALNGQWTNDAGKWVSRIKSNADKSERVVKEVENGIKERRIKTTVAQYAECIWGEFK